MLKKLITTGWLVLLCACSQLASAASTISVKTTPSNPTAPANVTFSAMVDAGSDPVLVTQVEYFKGGESLGVVTAAPFTLTVNNFAAGSYAIFAKATVADAQGTVLTSPAFAFTVAPGPGAANVFFGPSDQLNTPRAVTDSSGNLVWNWDSDPFGNASPNEQPTGQAPFVLNQRFPGQYYDKETNLHYNYFRDYDPTIGRYVQSDPIGLGGGINTFAYVDGNPISLTDPQGLCFGPVFPVCVVIAENTPALLMGTSVVVGVATGADVPGPAGVAGKEIRALGQYTLRVNANGFYPVMKRGLKEAAELKYCLAGDIWKVGTTKNFAKRYSQKYLDGIGEHGVTMRPEFEGTAAQALTLEEMKILNTIQQTGTRPPGNKINR